MLRRLFSRLAPGLMRYIEAESRAWMLRCPRCGYQISVWDHGGMRYRARGKAYRMGRCRGCGQVGMLRLYRPDRGDSPAGPR